MFDYSLDFTNTSSLYESIEKLANKIAKNGLLEFNGVKYRIIDFEFYLNSSSEIAQDPHTYNNSLQKTTGKIYDHASGLDFTFGDENNAAGILIRGIAKLSSKDENSTSQYLVDAYFDGPHKARTELISNLRFNEANMITFDETSKEIETLVKPDDIKIICTKRVNLTPKTADPSHRFINENLRYIVLIPRYYREEGKLIPNGNPIKIKGIEKEIKNALSQNLIDIQTAENILGYTIKL